MTAEPGPLAAGVVATGTLAAGNLTAGNLTAGTVADGTQAAGTLATGLFGTFAEFVDELRGSGVPVSTTEVLDATEALRHLPLEDREALKLGLAAAVKEEGHWRTYETLFELYFSLRGRGLAELSGTPVGELGEADSETELTASELAELAYKALMDGDPELMAALARAAVSRFAGMEPGRPVGGSYYVFKTLRQLQADALVKPVAQFPG